MTAALKVNADVHAPLPCVTDAFDVASGDLSLPGRVDRRVAIAASVASRAAGNAVRGRRRGKRGAAEGVRPGYLKVPPYAFGSDLLDWPPFDSDGGAIPR